MKPLTVAFEVSQCAAKIGLAVSSISELRQKINELTGLESDNYLLIDLSNSAIFEEDEYFQLMPPQSSIKIQKIIEDNQNININFSPEQFHYDSMEYLRKLAIKDPSLVPIDSIHLFWKHCESIGDKTLSNFAKNIIMKNPLEVFSSAGLREISISQWEEIVQWENIQCTEYELVTALSAWSSLRFNYPSDVINLFTNVVPHLRLGQFTFSQLVREIHSQVNFLTCETLYPFIRYHLLPKPDFLEKNKKLFEMRDYQKENYSVGQLTSKTIFQRAVSSANGKAWSLTIHPVKYLGLPNNYETLVSRKWNYPGCGTEYRDDWDGEPELHYVEAEFDEFVRVTKVIISSPTKGEFLNGGWGLGYIPQCSLEYSKDDGSSFELLRNFSDIIEIDGPIEIDLRDQDIIGKKFRISCPDQFALASFILE